VRHRVQDGGLSDEVIVALKGKLESLTIRGLTRAAACGDESYFCIHEARATRLLGYLGGLIRGNTTENRQAEDRREIDHALTGRREHSSQRYPLTRQSKRGRRDESTRGTTAGSRVRTQFQNPEAEGLVRPTPALRLSYR